MCLKQTCMAWTLTILIFFSLFIKILFINNVSHFQPKKFPVLPDNNSVWQPQLQVRLSRPAQPWAWPPRPRPQQPRLSQSIRAAADLGQIWSSYKHWQVVSSFLIDFFDFVFGHLAKKRKSKKKRTFQNAILCSTEIFFQDNNNQIVWTILEVFLRRKFFPFVWISHEKKDKV